MKRHVKENKAGMNSGTWNSKQENHCKRGSGDRRQIQVECVSHVIR